MTKLPQVLLNVPVTGKAKPVLDQPRLKLALGDIEAALNGRGRVLLRASGTEPVIRVMVEADQALMAQQAAESLADAVRASAAGMAM